MDCSSILASLPLELVEIVQQQSNTAALAYLAKCLLDKRNTDTYLPLLESLLPELVARWLSEQKEIPRVIGAFGRTIPVQLHLLQHARVYLTCNQADRTIWTASTRDELVELLLGLYRLCVADRDCLIDFIKPAELMFGLQHESAAVRFLSIRVLCLYLHAADAAMQEMTQKYVGTQAVDGPWEGREIDYRFLTLWESKRMDDLTKAFDVARENRTDAQVTSSTIGESRILRDEDLSGSIQVAGLLVSKLNKSHQDSSSSVFVETPTARMNMREFIGAIVSNQPVLLRGRAGAGKTAMVTHLADRLGKLDSMITLQLNEQSDVKILLGLYTSGAEPGTFTWKAGVLTTAVREGRWVFVEDLDRAPNEVISALLPLIERNELLLPGRGEVVKAAPGFKLIATVRSMKTTAGNEREVGTNLIGRRFWRQVAVQTPSDEELCSIMVAIFPHLAPRASALVEVYAKIRSITESHSFTVAVSSGSARPVSSRDFLKWCRRVNGLFLATSNFTEHAVDVLFLEAIDCFAGYLPEGEAFNAIAACAAQDLQIDPQRRDHILGARHIKLGIRESGSKSIQIGRVSLIRDAHARKHQIVANNFSANPYTARVLEKVAAAVSHREPLLLVGETGTGKTTTVQYLAGLMGKRLVPFNLSQQSESSDLLGGFKPVNMRGIVMGIQDEFEHLFAMAFSQRDNSQFTDLLNKSIIKAQWKRSCKLWRGAIAEVKKQWNNAANGNSADVHPSKKQRLDSGKESQLLNQPHIQSRWQKLIEEISQFEARLATSSSAFAFTFVEGNIVKAARNGDWILLDEINLAAPDTLEALADLLSSDGNGTPPSILLTEAGKVERIVAHPDFRVFAAMNPATDVGKRDLPAGIRSRFTELYVESPDRDIKSLQHIVQTYLGDGLLDKSIVSEISKLHLNIQQLSDDNKLVDGAGQKPHFSLRTLTRSLIFAKDIAPLCGLRRGLFEGFNMSYLTFLDKESEALLSPLLFHHIFNKNTNAKAELRKALKKPDDGREHIQYQNFWLRQGQFKPEAQPHYIITPFVQRNLDNLIRAVFSRRAPVLIQGPTSSGKTSMIEFLAKISGNKFVRINNHEHTDLQEYLGSYVSDSNGQLKFQEGVLVEALRNGYWIVLDELNLAPSDVLEALNRLLDDNRELLIPETQETIRPHEDFMLFATQNPAGLYGGRKPLSRAFRNRFLELHFDDIPVDELCEILHRRTQISESWSRRIVDVYKELSALRQETRLFETKSFATLRDLFRWALRKADTVEQLGVNGYMLLGERVRKAEERDKVREVIESVLSKRGPRIRLDVAALYSMENSSEITAYQQQASSRDVVWTKAMRRLYVLVVHALRNNEPVLLVGETGCGKTTVCQMLAAATGKNLHIVNAHQNTETGDLIGSQRPVRNRAAVETELREILLKLLPGASESHSTDSLLFLYDEAVRANGQQIDKQIMHTILQLRERYCALFQWNDGSLVTAMKSGHFFLLDEISLADDSVLERLNSVLEPGRSIYLAEKGPVNADITAVEGFQFLATMNPGGDYGKRELSPALRNRFTEIWVPSIEDLEDVRDIVSAKLPSVEFPLGSCIVEFASWFSQAYSRSTSSSVSIRDVLACVDFINSGDANHNVKSLLHAVSMVFIDSLGANPAGMLSIDSATLEFERRKCVEHLQLLSRTSLFELYGEEPQLFLTQDHVQIGEFRLPRTDTSAADASFTFLAPTTRINAMRIVRALQISKPLLIEGDPGVGKTTLVSSLARLVGKRLVRINLSEQTDLMDLFGSDIPVEGADAGVFAWRDAPFLTAMKRGDWVLLDEMNLASQSVLEGLNACLDHRGEAYIAELNQTFRRHPRFKLFAAQNPHHQGGGRKGLPASFVNRFTVVYADAFSATDLDLICQHIYPEVDPMTIHSLTTFVAQLDQTVRRGHLFSSIGCPWEFNLRDTLRWLQLLENSTGVISIAKAASRYDLVDIVFGRRFRSIPDETAIKHLFERYFEQEPTNRDFFHILADNVYQVGLSALERAQVQSSTNHLPFEIPASHLPVLESLMLCIKLNWPVILVGSSGSGKSSLLQHVAATHGARLITLSLNPDIDAMDLVGGFEQADNTRRILQYLARLKEFLSGLVLRACNNQDAKLAVAAIEVLAMSSATSVENFKDINSRAQKVLLEDNVMISDVTLLLEEGNSLAALPIVAEKAKFEWVDGILVQALERGDWLVLDNANLCSSSVLDRLNSLLEPNGSLSISEHPLSNGEARIIYPHHNFRIFLTMDPRHGELSRAMRNRALELYVQSDEKYRNRRIHGPSEAIMDRYGMILHLLNDPLASMEVMESSIQLALDHLSIDDLRILGAFKNQLSVGLVHAAGIETLNTAIDRILDHSANTSWHDWSKQSQRMISSNLEDNGSLELFTLHPLNNMQALRCLPVELKGVIVHSSIGDAIQIQYTISDLIRTIHGNLNQGNASAQSMSGSKRFLALKNNVVEYICSQFVAIDRYLVFLGDQIGIKASAVSVHDLETFQKLQINWKYLLERLSVVSTTEMDIRICLLLIHEFLAQAHGGASTGNVGFSRHQESVLRELLSIDATSGWYMEDIWTVFKSPIARDYTFFSCLQRLESLADEFDQSRWSSCVELTDVVAIRDAFCRVATLIKYSQGQIETEPLFDGIKVALTGLREVEFDPPGSKRPHFQDDFEFFTRRIELAIAANPDLEAEFRDILSTTGILTRDPTRDLMSRGKENSRASTLLRGLVTYVGCTQNDTIESELIIHQPQSLLAGVQKCQSVPLRNLSLLKTELRTLGEIWSLHARALCRDQYLELKESLLRIKDAMIRATANSHALLDEATVDELSMYYLEPVQTFLNTDEQSTIELLGIGYVRMALACILCYVPTVVVDPLSKQFTAKDMQWHTYEYWQAKHSASRHFDTIFTGQQSMRTQQIAQIISKLGEVEPPPSGGVIQRPPESQIQALQHEFDRVLRITGVLSQRLRKGELHDTSTIPSLLQVTRRLQEQYRAYADITHPLVGFLTLLIMGLQMTNGSYPIACIESQSQQHTLMSLFTPHGPSSGIAQLRKLSLLRAVQNTISDEDYTTIFETLSVLHRKWKHDVESAQEKNMKESNLYTFKGSYSDEEEEDEREFDEMFPDPENEEAAQMSRDQLDDITASIELANLHKHLVNMKNSSNISLLDYIRRASQSSKESLSIENVPILLLRIHDQLDLLSQASTNGRIYNIYKDQNIIEALKLIALIRRAQARFKQIQQSWPDHATLAEVLRICDQVLDFSITEPVIKFLTKCEKLHEAVNEWQKVASKEFSASIIYDDLTSLLVSWRRLELSTWLRLFDLEVQNCNEDAKRWWFVAYESIIAASENIIAAAESLTTHTLHVIITLEKFMSATSLGQFSARLELLSSFADDLRLRIKRLPELEPIYSSLYNFVAYYSRFVNPINDHLQKQRIKLERDVKEVVQLASWKDTNIDALKQSAKNSHRKLFKIVRKFRGLLGQSASTIISQGPPEEQLQHFQPCNLDERDAQAAHNAIEICSKRFNDWSAMPSRYRHVFTTVNLMTKLTSTQESHLDGASHMTQFITQLTESMEELRKSTPSLLTEDNKDNIKHLKVQKRTLFAETLKELRRMGLQFNLPSEVTQQQSTAAKILVSTPCLEHAPNIMTNASYHFHKMLSLMEQVRDVQREHSADLTPAEITRSCGYLEALLQKVIQQRSTIARSDDVIKRISEQLLILDNLADTTKQGSEEVLISKIDHASKEQWHTFGLTIRRLVHICETYSSLASAQSDLGDFDASTATQGLIEWSKTFSNLAETIDNYPDFPILLGSSVQIDIQAQGAQALNDFRGTIKEWIAQIPQMEILLQSLLPFVSTETNQSALANGTKVVGISTVQTQVFELVDITLAFVQDLEKAHSSLPENATTPSWFTIEDKCRSSAILLSSLHTFDLKLDNLLQTLHHLSQISLESSIHLLTGLAPILHKFHAILHTRANDYIKFHDATSHLTVVLARTFVNLGKNGFCTPPDKSAGKEAGAEKLEGGTGLGDGEGAEDISKDIGDDEDLDELAEQEQDKTERKDMEDEQDAVDMADADLQGQEDEVEEKTEDGEEKESGDEGDEEDMDSEVGDVDDLGPSTVDEKMWDDGGKENEKEKESKEGKGPKDEEQVAAEGDAEAKEGEGEDGDDQEPEMPADEDEALAHDKPEMADPHLNDGENLDLPDEMDIDGQSQAGSDKDDLDDLGDMEDMDDLDNTNDVKDDQMMEEENDSKSMSGGEEADEAEGENMDVGSRASEDGESNADEEGAEETRDGVIEDETEVDDQNEEADGLQTQDKDNAAEDAVPSDQKGSGLEADDKNTDQQDTSSMAKNTQGAEAENSGAQASGDRGAGEDDDGPKDAVGRSEDDGKVDSQPFKKLGDVLEKWYNQQKSIKAPKEEQMPRRQENDDIDMKDADFEHLPDDSADADAQALGAATQEQAKALDNDNAVPVDEDEQAQPFVEDQMDQEQADAAESINEQELRKDPTEPHIGQPNAFIGNSKTIESKEEVLIGLDAKTELDDVEHDLADINIASAGTTAGQSLEVARNLWAKHELATRTLSATLSEQLRLILAPTLATKLRGDFRTGKRLNIKRIIPYIASSYKRDKIWMRRSVPSKRSYQIMIALDDSKSMADAGHDEGSNKVDLALQTLALIAKSLSMLETGELCFLGFGQNIKTAHSFETPFTDDAGAKVFQAFEFQQEKTDVRRLINEAIDLFRNARSSSYGANADLWQLMLIVSDGVCEDHETITQLVRQAQDERIMIVFVIVDQLSSPSMSTETVAKTQSIMDLQTADFRQGANGEMQLVRKKYMDSFPFRWWIVVRDVKELPVVLAAALRQWFQEVVDQQ